MKEKTKDPSSGEDNSTPTAEGSAAADNPEQNSHDDSDDMSADELAAFKKIMGEIEGQDEEQVSGHTNGNSTGENDEKALTDDERATINEAIEINHSQDDTVSDRSNSRNAEARQSEDDGDEGLDEDQQKAFESILAQIESDDNDGSDRDTDPGKETGDGQEVDAADDFSAELEKVIKEAHVETTAGPGDVQKDETVDELDDDQQKAFESIMAQIESDNNDGAVEVTDFGKEAGDTPVSNPADDFSAELERVVQDVDAAEHNENPDAEHTQADDAMDRDRRQAVESTLDPLEERGTENAAPGLSHAVAADPQMDGGSEDQEVSAAEPSIDGTGEAAKDMSVDIDDILKEIRSTDNESNLPEMADRPVSEPVKVDAIDKTVFEDDKAAGVPEDHGPAHEDNPHPAPRSGNYGEPAKSAEKPPTIAPSVDSPSVKEPAPAMLETPQTPKPLREATRSTGDSNKKTILASAIVFLFLALAGFFYWMPTANVDGKPSSPDTDAHPQDVVANTLPAPQVQEPVPGVDLPSDLSRLKTAGEDLDRLRNELIDKQAEIKELRAYYQVGIDAEIQGIVDRVRKTGGGKNGIQTATADPRINLGLSAIQRRDVYIKKLETPANILFWNSEELLFLSRKAGLLALMAGKTSDIDIDGFIKQADEIRNVHASQLAQLDIDAVPASPRTLASIWQDIEKRLPTTTVKREATNQVTDADNATIWKDICEGDFSQKHKLTMLPPEAARCLIAWKGKDLFLSGLTDLPPESARHLADWEGDWLGLNGLEELSPEAAVHLSRWKGKGLSLNGLSRLSPRVVAILSEWQGDQIELVNVTHMAHWENPNTWLYLSENLKRKGHRRK